jgi:hypothetical protein
MELITLCGLVIVVFGVWVELELAAKRVVKLIRSSRFSKDSTNTAVRQPVYMGRMSLCLAKPSHYRG